jgi:putative methyltransferase
MVNLGEKQIINLLKLVYKLVIETLKFRSVLEDLLKTSTIAKDEKGIGKGRLLCLTYEFIIGNGIKHGKYKKMFNRYKSQLQNGFTLMKIKRKAKTADDLLPEEVRNPLPKFVRVNTLMARVSHGEISDYLAGNFNYYSHTCLFCL